MNILVIGDIVGKGGRKAVKKLLPGLRREFSCAVCIANAENVAGGAGLSEKCVLELKSSGVDIITTGDHVWDQRDFINDIQHLPFVLRPANYFSGQPGRGYGLFPNPLGGDIAVINLAGRVFMARPADCPFEAVDRILDEIGDRASVILVDMHAEATSEKIAMGRHLDGRVTAVWGTHTHVQTADEQIFAGGTAYLSDLGMVGARDSILGRDITAVLHRFVTGMPARFKVVDDDVVLHGCVIDVDQATGKARSIQRLKRANEE